MLKTPLFVLPVRRRESCSIGFTLIELLTVIAIIGILAAILIPVVGAVRDRARGAKCTSNLRQSTMAILQFAMDDGGSMVMHWGGSGGGRNLWSDRLIDNDYLDVGSRSVVFCPASPPLDDLADRTKASPWATYGFGMIGYAGERVAGAPLYRFNLDQVETASRYFLLADSAYPSTGFQRMRISSYSARSMDGVQARHGGNANMSFADGHVASMSPERLAEARFLSYFDEDLNVRSLEQYRN